MKCIDATRAQNPENLTTLEWSRPADLSEYAVPRYLRDVYRWAYLDRRNARYLDHDAVVWALLWGNSNRLQQALFSEIEAGEKVLQAAHVYGRLIPKLAQTIGRAGRLDVIDIAPLQVALCRRKLRPFANAHARVADAAEQQSHTYDAAISFFLLHELPNSYKHAVVDALLSSVSETGKVVFIDYHGPASWHPLRGLMKTVFDHLEPFAETMWHHKISDFAGNPELFDWRTETYFGGLYQKTVASRRN